MGQDPKRPAEERPPDRPGTESVEPGEVREDAPPEVREAEREE